VYLLIAVILGIVCAVIAQSKGRSVVGWFFLGFIFGIFGLVASFIVSDLKEARAKEEHMETEQRRLREQLRQEQLKTEQLRKYTQVRLDLHDHALNMDTRHVGPSLEPGQTPPALDQGVGLPDVVTGQPVPVTSGQECAHCRRKIEEGERVFFSGGHSVCVQCGERSREVAARMQAENEGWYYRLKDEAIGPVPLQELKYLMRDGKIDPWTDVWHESLGAWTPAGQVDGLAWR
jgi:hypothetical protein